MNHVPRASTASLPNIRWKYWNPYVVYKIVANVLMYIMTHVASNYTLKKEVLAHIVPYATTDIRRYVRYNNVLPVPDNCEAPLPDHRREGQLVPRAPPHLREDRFDLGATDCTVPGCCVSIGFRTLKVDEQLVGNVGWSSPFSSQTLVPLPILPISHPSLWLFDIISRPIEVPHLRHNEKHQ